MKNKIFTTIFIALLCLLAGCASTTITEKTYKDDGQTLESEKITQTSGNPFVILAQNSKDKSWTLHQGGWFFDVGYLEWGLRGGTLDNTFASFTNSQFGADIAESSPKILGASKYSIKIDKDGLSSQSDVDDTK